ncbi:MAG TPA: GNAT family N-acetyltransferase [Rubrivivax sp.]
MNEGLLARIEDAGLNASAPPQQRWLDGWLVRYSPGKAKRARCINAVASGVRPLDDKLAECAALYREAGLPMFVRVTPFTQPAGLDGSLAQRGWCSVDDTRVMVLDRIDAMVEGAVPDGVEALGVGAADYARAVGSLRGSPSAQIDAQAQRVALSPVPYRGVLWRRDGEVLACGQFAREGDLVGLYDVVTAPAARGQGLAAALCAHLLARARADGARVAYLQVDAANSAARALYRRLGFADTYRYHYRCEEAGAN